MSKKHNQTPLIWTFLTLYADFRIRLHLLKWDGCVLLPKNILHKNLQQSHNQSQWVDINSIYAKKLLEMLFRVSRAVRFFIFSQGCTWSWMCPQYLLNIVSNIFKVNNNDTRTMFDAYIVNFEHIYPLILLLLLVNLNK